MQIISALFIGLIFGLGILTLALQSIGEDLGLLFSSAPREP